VFDEGLQLPTERGSVLVAQVDLVVRAVEAEPHRFVRRTSVEVVFELDGYLLGHPDLHLCDELSAPYRQPAAE